MKHHPPRPSHTSRRAGVLVGVVALAVLAGLAVADSDRRKTKPVLPAAWIDNEGPVTAIRRPRKPDGDGHARSPVPPRDLFLPWRPGIRLDLILPIRDPHRLRRAVPRR